MVIYLSRYDRVRSTRMLSLNYHQIIGKIEEPEGRKYLMVDDFMLDKVLDKIKEIIGIEKFMVRF